MSAIEEIKRTVLARLDEFVKWPKEAVLLWRGCIRKKYHDYPPAILDLLASLKIYRRNWSNDPAIHAYLVAGGERPTRRYKQYGWDIHHLYVGLPTAVRRNGIHAVKSELHFTQSAGLVAVHPIADALYEEDLDFAELLRRESFNRFGYDPDGLYTTAPHDNFGFVAPHMTRIIYPPANA